MRKLKQTYNTPLTQQQYTAKPHPLSSLLHFAKGHKLLTLFLLGLPLVIANWGALGLVLYGFAFLMVLGGIQPTDPHARQSRLVKQTIRDTKRFWDYRWEVSGVFKTDSVTLKPIFPKLLKVTSIGGDSVAIEFQIPSGL